MGSAEAGGAAGLGVGSGRLGVPTTSTDVLTVVPRPLVTFLKAMAGPYAPGGSRCAFGSTVTVIVTPLVSAVPMAGLAESHDGVLIEYLIEPPDARTRN
jgi:hypothetical protein